MLPSHNIGCYDVAVGNEMEDGEMDVKQVVTLKEETVAVAVVKHLGNNSPGIEHIFHANNLVTIILDNGDTFEITIKQTRNGR